MTDSHPAVPFMRRSDRAEPAASAAEAATEPAGAVAVATAPSEVAADVAAPSPTSTPTEDEAAAKPKSSPGRNHWLDAVRGIAVIRVVLWHAFASAFLSWTITTMPAMFFVAGSLLAYSLDKRPFDQLLNKRMKRLLIPYWTLGGALLLVLAIVHRMDPSATTDMSFGQFFAWLVPIVDPRGSAWEAGWVATPLWYLRCYLWLLLLSPLLRSAHRRWGARVLMVPFAAVFVVDWLIRHPEIAPETFTTYKWYLGDLFTYSFFLMLGFAHHDGAAKRLSRRDRLEWAALGLAAALLWIARIDVIDNVVNNSYPMLLFVGIAWLGFFLAFEQEIAKLQTMRYTAPVMRWIGQRAMTVYLWHTTAIVFAYWARAQFAPESSRLVLIPIILVGTMFLSLLFGWVEDISAGKPAEWWPGRPMQHRWNGLATDKRRSYVGALGGLTVGIIAMGFLLGGTGSAQASGAGSSSDSGGGGLALPPAPSAKPPEVTFGDAPPADDDDGGGGLALPPAPSAKPPEVEFETAEAPELSQQPPEAVFEDAAESAVGQAPEELAFVEGDYDEVQARVQVAIDDWLAGQGIDGMYLGVSMPNGDQLLFTTGTLPDGSAMTVEDDFDITSVTKTMTSALIMTLVDDGVISLDDTIPDLEVYPGYPFAGRVTYRQLLMHTSGITTYKETDVYTSDGWWERELTVLDALDLSSTQDLAWEPGTDVGYSSTGYITLGLVGGQLLGTDYETALQERVFARANMPNSFLDTTPYQGWVGFSSGGVRSTLSDLLNWGAALYRDRTVISNEAVEAVINLDNPWSAGLGSYPVCPCYLDDDGNKVVASIGHNGGQATVQWSWEDDLVIAAGVTESWTDETTQSHIVELLINVRQAVAGS
ncbi:MAG: serine hydrolase [Actinomycetota bacterium]